MAIIALISVFALIAGPNLSKQIKTSDKEEKNVLTQNIENASMIYAGKYFADKIVDGEEISFKLNDLIEDRLLDLDKEECEGKLDSEIKVDSSGNFDFEALEHDNCYKDKEE